MTIAKNWDGIGPKEACLLRMKWAQPHGGSEWVEFGYEDADGGRGEDGTQGNWNRYASGGIYVTEEEDGIYKPEPAFEITHWAELPVIPREFTRDDLLK